MLPKIHKQQLLDFVIISSIVVIIGLAFYSVSKDMSSTSDTNIVKVK